MNLYFLPQAFSHAVIHTTSTWSYTFHIQVLPLNIALVERAQTIKCLVQQHLRTKCSFPPRAIAERTKKHATYVSNYFVSEQLECPHSHKSVATIPLSPQQLTKKVSWNCSSFKSHSSCIVMTSLFTCTILLWLKLVPLDPSISLVIRNNYTGLFQY